jgi:hypothetical protein
MDDTLLSGFKSLAERVGVFEMIFCPFANFIRQIPTLSDSAS